MLPLWKLNCHCAKGIEKLSISKWWQYVYVEFEWARYTDQNWLCERNRDQLYNMILIKSQNKYQGNKQGATSVLEVW